MKPARLLLLLAALGASACGDDTPTEPSGTPGSPIQEIFTTTLSPRGSTFYAFGASSAGAARVTLIGVTNAAGAVATPALTLGFGVPKGTGCGTTTTVVVTPGLASHITAPIDASIYCVSVTDPGVLTGDVTFYVRIAYPLAGIPSGTAGPETWNSTLTPAGSATRTFVAETGGSVPQAARHLLDVRMMRATVFLLCAPRRAATAQSPEGSRPVLRRLAGERHLGDDLPRRIDDLECRLRARMAFLDGAVEQNLGAGLARVGNRLIEIGKVEPLRIRLEAGRRPDVEEEARHGDLQLNKGTNRLGPRRFPTLPMVR